MPLAERIHLIKSQKRAWETLSPECIVPLRSDWNGAYPIPQPFRHGAHFIDYNRLDPERPGFSSYFDPYQDVLFLIQAPPSFSTQYVVCIFITSLKSNGQRIHPLASKTVLWVDRSEICRPRLSVSGEHLAALFTDGERSVVIWNWKTGQKIVHMAISEWESRQPDRFSDFVFLSSNAFMMVGYSCLHLYTLPRTMDVGLLADVTLQLPPHNCIAGQAGDIIRCFTAPFCGTLPPEYTAFRLDPRERIHVLEISMNDEELAAYIVINTAQLLRILNDVSIHNAKPGQTHTDWELWGPTRTTIIALPWEMRAIIDNMSIHGTRMAMSWMICKDPPQYRHAIYDFSQKRDPGRTGGKAHTAVGTGLRMSYEFYANGKGEIADKALCGAVFKSSVYNTMPFSVTELRPTYFRKFRQLILGRDYILALVPSLGESRKDAEQFDFDPDEAWQVLERDMTIAGFPPGTGRLVFEGDSQDPDRYPFQSCFFLF
ncbi:unnamed protein product [Peniophora sp. CBMAI 1063]|nr:unnamed protein product [Peniophora sp. CBMAI 1063]